MSWVEGGTRGQVRAHVLFDESSRVTPSATQSDIIRRPASIHGTRSSYSHVTEKRTRIASHIMVISDAHSAPPSPPRSRAPPVELVYPRRMASSDSVVSPSDPSRTWIT